MEVLEETRENYLAQQSQNHEFPQNYLYLCRERLVARFGGSRGHKARGRGQRRHGSQAWEGASGGNGPLELKDSIAFTRAAVMELPEDVWIAFFFS